jgi:Ca2+/H+ antiporter
MNPEEPEVPQEPRKPHPPEWLPTWEIFAVGLGDVIVLILFAIIGRASHDVASTAGPVLGTLNTAFPFIVAWLVLAAVLGGFSGKAFYPIGRVIGRTLLASILAAPLGVLLRAAIQAAPRQFYAFRWDSIQPSFILVATLSTSVMLLVWRVAWSRIRRLWWPELP